MVLFGTGGEATIPPGVAGEVTPRAPAPFVSGVQVYIVPVAVAVEYAGRFILSGYCHGVGRP